MLYPAQLYKDELQRKFVECWYNPKYSWYFGGEYFEYQIPNNAEYKHCFVHLNESKEVDGFFSYNFDRASRCMSNFGLISFSENNVPFIHDVFKRVQYMLENEAQRIEFWAFKDNPINKSYEKLVKRFGGTKCGEMHRTAYFDGKYHDTVFYEILSEDYMYHYKKVY